MFSEKAIPKTGSGENKSNKRIKNVTKYRTRYLQSFLGMINYLHIFILKYVVVIEDIKENY